MKRIILFSFFLAAILAMTLSAAPAESQKLILTSTTSTQDSGLFDALIPAFEKLHNCQVKVIAVGTGQAIRLASDGNADVLLVHDRAAEEKFVADGFGVKRFDVMHNDFIIVGPLSDPAHIKNLKASDAFKKIAASQTPFVSRGDDSGTHKKELKIWNNAGGKPTGAFYMESGAGMEATLRIANEKSACCLTDRATWLAHQKETDNMTILCEGDPTLLNLYSVIAVSPAKYPHVNHSLANAFITFITGPTGQKIIREFGKDKYGASLFFPNVIR